MNSSKEKIAIVGSGIAGLSASFLLSKKFNVHLFEKNHILGGHTRTINFKDDLDHQLSIDTGFIVFNNKNYPDLVSFLNLLEVKTLNSNMSFSVSSKKYNIEYGGKNFNTLFAQRKNFLSIKFIKLLFEIIKFYKKAKNFYFINEDDELTIEDFLLKNRFSEEIKDLHIYPMLSSIWSSNKKNITNLPFASFVNFFYNHGLFDFKKRPQWKFVSGGSYEYIKALLKKDLFKIDTNFKIEKIIRKNEKIHIKSNKGSTEIFDKIIFATHADQILNLIENPTKTEVDILSKFKYSKNLAYLHSDDSFMPKKKIAWSSWNFLQNTNMESFSLTYWMNNLQKINSEKNFFVSINPPNVPKNIVDQTIFEHPIFSIETLKSQKKLASIQGIKNTYYCGSYCGYGFHEDGIQSAVYVASKLNITLPWKREKNFVSRLNY